MIPPSSGPGWYEVPLYAPATGGAFGTTGQLNQLGHTVTIPPHQANDLVVITAYRANSTPASAPANAGDFSWTSVPNSTATGVSLRTVWSVASGGTTGTTTMASAANWVVHVYRPTGGATLSVGATGIGGANNSTTITYAALTLLGASGTSTVYRAAGRDAGNAAVATAPTSYTNEQKSPAALPVLASHDRAALTANPTADGVTQPRAVWAAQSVEIRTTGAAIQPVEVDTLYAEAATPGGAGFTLDSQSILEASAWSIGNFSSTANAHLGGSLFIDAGTATISGGGTLHSAVNLPLGSPSSFVFKLDAQAVDYGG